jgi:opacity protein-like surface antigen
MRRSLAILLAAATAVSASAATFTQAQAAPRSAPAVTTGAAVEQVRERHGHGGHRGHGGHHRGHGGHHGGHHRGHHNGFNSFDSFGVFPGFAFGFGFPQVYYQPYYGYGDCFRTWDGQLICR